MTPQNLFILGAGGFAREVLSLLDDAGRSDEVAGFVEENSKRAGQLVSGTLVYDASHLESLQAGHTRLIAGIGSPLRSRWIMSLEASGFSFDRAIHPDVRLHKTVEIGHGCVVCAGVQMTCDIQVDSHTILNLAATVGHDCILGRFVTVSPGAMISGNVTIGDRTWIGSGVVIREGIRIGKGVLVGAGAVVTKDISDNVLSVGVPAKPVRNINEADWKDLL